MEENTKVLTGDENQNYEETFKIAEQIAAISATIKASNFATKLKSGGRMDFYCLPMGKQPYARLDHPHKGYNFHHLNINPKYSKIPDPHYKVPELAFKSAPIFLKVCEIAGEAVFYVAVARDSWKLVTALSKDIQNKTTEESVYAVTNIGGTWGGGYLGGTLGAKFGTLVFPGFGTFLGVLVGAILGAHYGPTGTKYAKDKIMEADREKLVAYAKEKMERLSASKSNSTNLKSKL